MRRDMEMTVFGHAGIPILVFPTTKGRFYEYEDRGLIRTLAHKYESGQLQAFCVDSVDAESWYNYGAHPGYRIHRHLEYESYILNEVVPLIRAKNQNRNLVAHGCSFGGFHANMIALRHPWLFTHMISLSGAFDIKAFIAGYYSDAAYFVCPQHFIPNLSDHGVLEQMRRQHLIYGTGHGDICLGANYEMTHVLGRKAIPHHLDVWNEFYHDWPWWERMVHKYLGPMGPW